MGEVISFRAARQARQGEAADRQAAANRLRFGRTRPEKQAEVRRLEEARRFLDQRRLNPDGEDPEAL